MKRILLILSAAALGLAGAKADLAGDIETILTIGGEGAGNEAASKAWQAIADATEEAAFFEVLQAVGKNNLADNWLLSAASVVAEKNAPDVEALKTFLLETSNAPLAREMVLDLLRSTDGEAATKLFAQLRNDPAEPVRRVAVQFYIDEATRSEEAGQKNVAAEQYREALQAARDADQIKTISAKLEEFGEKVDLPKQFGFLMRWKTIGPFDNLGRAGFDTVFPPEERVALDATHIGKDDAEIQWKEFETANPFGMVDFNKAYGMLKEVTAYAYTEFDSAEDQEVEIRLGCKNAWKVWVNGELVFGRDEYHRGMRIDQYRLKANFKKGLNTILIKCCQNEQKERWTVEWQFQMRVTDHTGTAILATNRGPTPETDKVADLKPNEA
ncbi:MAG: hypothetical protein AAGA58_11910 [Verrucomicrobiota bacterium]